MKNSNQPFSSEVEIIDIESIEENDNREIAISEISDSATVLTGNDDIEYLITCIVIIAVVNLRIEPDIETVIKKLNYD